MNLWHIFKLPPSPINAIDVYTIRSCTKSFKCNFLNFVNLWQRYTFPVNYPAPRSCKTEFTSVAESVSSEMAAPIPIPIELVRNLMSEGGWPLMIDQWPILIPMNTNTNINTNTNDPNTNWAGEEFDDSRWINIDQLPTWWREWKGDKEKGWNCWLISLLFLWISEISIFF